MRPGALLVKNDLAVDLKLLWGTSLGFTHGKKAKQNDEYFPK